LNSFISNEKDLHLDQTSLVPEKRFLTFSSPILQTCTRRPCPELEKCPSPYDEMITKINDCGCTVLVECRTLKARMC